MPSLRDILAFSENIADTNAFGDEGIHAGNPDKEVHKLLTCWMPTPEAIQEAIDKGCDAIIGHETLYYPYDAAIMDNNPEGWEQWPVNALRRELLDKNGISYLRVHMLMDFTHILSTFARVIGFERPFKLLDFCVPVYNTDMTVQALADRLHAVFPIDSMRSTIPKGLDFRIKKICIACGAFMQNNVELIEELRTMNVDTIVAGEVNDLALRYAHENGINLIEVSHELSENDGIVAYAHTLKEAYPTLEIHNYTNPRIWQAL